MGIPGDDDRWPGKTLDQSPGNDSDDAGIPASAVDNEGWLLGSTLLEADLEQSILQDLPGIGAALLVQAVQLLCVRHRCPDIVGEEPVQRDIRRLHPSGGIDAGTDHITDIEGVDLALFDAGDLAERFEARQAPSPEEPDAAGSERPVFTPKRHHVGDRCERCIGHVHLSIRVAQKRTNESECHTCRRKLRFDVGVVAALRRNESDFLWQFMMNPVVVDDDDLQPK